jgi:hypothetical protein
MLYTETVEKGTLALIKRLMNDATLSQFYLVGGTALSLKIGHRKSIDIDLFTDKDFNSEKISKHLESAYQPSAIRSIKNGVFSQIDGVKVDVISHQYPLIENIENAEGIRIVSLLDIGAMKLNAINGNGTRLKDFIDVYKLLEHHSLNEFLQACETKYADINQATAKNALLYHEDIDFSVKLDFIGIEIKWADVTTRLKQAAVNPKQVFGQRELLSKKRQESINPAKGRQKKRGL